MRKLFLVLFMSLLAILAACSNNNNDEGDTINTTEGTSEAEVLKVAAVESPMTDVVEIAKDLLAKDNITVEVVEMSDYIQPNEALENKEVDATFSQHVPFMKQFNENTGASLKEVEAIYFANFGLYADGYDDINDLPDDVTIGIANDPSNIDRSLRLLASHELIELDEIDEGAYYSLEDIVEGSSNYQFEQAGIASLSRLYDDVDAVIMNPTHASHLELTPADDALVTEKEDNLFAITLVAREDNVDSELIQKLKEAMTSEEVREFLESREGESAVPAF